MAKSNGLGLPQTKGEFKLRGFVIGMNRENAFLHKDPQEGNPINTLSFGINTAPESTTYVQIQGWERDKVYYYKRPAKKGEKGETKAVAWENRFDPQPEGFRLIGVNLGLEKDDDGRNIIKTYTEYDAAEEVYNKLDDGQEVFVRGELEFSSYKNQNQETVKNKRFNVRQLYLSGNIDFDDEDFVEVNDFKQRIIFMGIEKVDDKENPHFIVNAKIVNYNSIEDTEFVINNPKLAITFKNKLKPYTAITVWGKIINKVDSEEIEEKDVWGEQDSFKNIKNTYIRQLIITGADPDTIDTTTYSKDKIDEALRAYKEFGEETNSWGSDNALDDDSGDDLPW